MNSSVRLVRRSVVTPFQVTIGVFAISATLVSAVRCNVESNFILSEDSRLPRWFGTYDSSRNDIIVELVVFTTGPARMTLYQPGKHGFWGVGGEKRAQLDGELRWHPVTEKRLNEDRRRDFEASYPRYMVMVIDSDIEVLEFRRPGPVFYISDDPALKQAAVGAAELR